MRCRLVITLATILSSETRNRLVTTDSNERVKKKENRHLS